MSDVTPPTLGTLICATAGSVDDGKSTLIGRILLDARALMRDQLAHIEEVSARRGFSRTELALVTDGLRAEREQGITIDAAWRYFATPRRRFVLADTPGHVQYTRNMVTGASQAEAAIVLIDAERGLTEQTRRHLAITALLRVPVVFVVVNKMDRVGFEEARFESLAAEARRHVEALPWETRLRFIPVCALDGDNVVERSTRMPWYDGPAVLESLETVRVAPSTLGVGVLPVAWVIRPQREDFATFRGLAGRLVGGGMAVGDRVLVAPGMLESSVTRIDRHVIGDVGGQALAESGESIVVSLADDVDAGRGAYVVQGAALPDGLQLRQSVTLDAAWLATRPARAGMRLWLKHQSRRVQAKLVGVSHRLDVSTGATTPADELKLNDLGRLQVVLGEPILATSYAQDRALGSALLVDPADGETVAATMLVNDSG
ncbi:MAG: 50S ribosome-binding GTPase [Deltaproteobacteria bacterium]|nr:50S ribosome-binding GTPase [Deltaproteobacteria bacterium]